MKTHTKNKKPTISKKVTNEKPVSLNLDFKEALAALLAVKPPSKNKKVKKENKEPSI